MAGSALPFTGEDLEVDLMTSGVDLDKSDSSIKKPGEGRRKSILPWNNISKNGKKTMMLILIIYFRYTHTPVFQIQFCKIFDITGYML